MGAGAMTAAEAACAERPENGAVSASDGMPSMGVLISTSSGRGVASCSDTCRCMSGACGIDTDTQDTCWGTAHSLIRARPGPSVGSRHQLPEASGDECRRRRSRDSVHWRRMKATSSRTSCALRAARNASFSLSAACHCPMRSCTWSLFKTCGETWGVHALTRFRHKLVRNACCDAKVDAHVEAKGRGSGTWSSGSSTRSGQFAPMNVRHKQACRSADARWTSHA